MSAKILDGKALADLTLKRLACEVVELEASRHIIPSVAFVRVGEHAPSIAYVKRKQEVAASLGMRSRLVELPEKATQAEIISVVHRLSADKSVHGILVQSPLPAHVEPSAVFNSVLYSKDVDGFSATNLGHLVQDDPSSFVACTPLGILELLNHYKVPLKGKHVVVIGRSLIVGRPLSLLLSHKDHCDATVTSCNKQTENLAAIARSADVLVVAAGAPGLVKADWVKPGAAVVDVGITRIEDATRKTGFRLVGDVDFDTVSKVAGWISPVPGGVGPMTVAMLMANTLKAAKQS